MIGFLYLLLLNFIIICIVSRIKKYKYKRFIQYITLVTLNFFILYNTSDWNEGRMAGFSYIIPLLKPATDALNDLLLMSIFSLFIPFVIYIVFIALMIHFCKIFEEE